MKKLTGCLIVICILLICAMLTWVAFAMGPFPGFFTIVFCLLMLACLFGPTD